MSFNTEHFRALTCKILSKAEHYYVGMYSPQAVELMQLTCAAESDYGTNIYQLGGGCGLGLFQMEPSTAIWLWSGYMKKYPKLLEAIVDIAHVAVHDDFALEHNLAYQILLARIRYLPYPFPIPPANDIAALARYWKYAYNTVGGKGMLVTAEEKYNRYCN